MPVFERRCLVCWWTTDFSLEKFNEEKLCPQCGHQTERIWTSKMVRIIRDEFVTPLVDDVMDVERQVFHTKSEHRRAMKERGLTVKDRHLGVPGSDKSPHTTSWNSGPPPGYDPRPMCQLSEHEQARRREQDLIAELYAKIDAQGRM